MLPSRPWAAVLGLVLSGCATLDESQCRSTNWFELGSRDGRAGYSRDRLDQHREACSEFGLSPNATDWEQGYVAGLEDYCTVNNGYLLGRRGAYYGNVCPVDLEADFVSAFELGRDTNEVEREIESLNGRINSIETRLARDRELQGEQREGMRRQLYDLYRQLSWLRRTRDRLENEWRRRY